MSYNHGIQQYKKTVATCTGPEKLIVLIYDHLVMSLNEACSAINDNDIVKRNECINKAQSIITELRNNLDHEIGKEIAKNLDALYDFMFKENLEALIDNDISHIQASLTTISPIHNAWKKISITGISEISANECDSGVNPAINNEELIANNS
jgi:flagellar secretion chaperone FliS